MIRCAANKGAMINADEAGSWEGLQDRFEVRRINHQEAHSTDAACTSSAKECFKDVSAHSENRLWRLRHNTGQFSSKRPSTRPSRIGAG
jgi:hypothetical protein